MTKFCQILLFTSSLVLSGGVAHAIITDLNDSTDNWTAIEYFKQSDYYNDEQAQKGGGDIVGDATNVQSGFYKRYDYGVGGVADDGDDAMAFRVRLGDNSSSYIYIGFDVDDGTNLGVTSQVKAVQICRITVIVFLPESRFAGSKVSQCGHSVS